MPAHMLPKPPRGTAQKARRATKRAKDRQLAVNAKKVLQRDGGACRVCGSRDGLQVHHIVYRSRGGDHSTGNLVALCGVCHDRVHAGVLRLFGDADGGLGSLHGSVTVFAALDRMLTR